MDPIGIVPSLITPAPTIPAATPQQVPQVSLPVHSDTDSTQADTSAQAVDQKRGEVVQQAAQQIANIYVVSDQTFTIYKDATGQYITRYTSLRDGKVTYIPQPTLFKLGGSSSGAQVVKIQA